MKSLIVILLSSFTLLTSCSVNQIKITPRVIKSAKQLPIALKPGTYSNKQMKDVFKVLSETPNLEVMTAPSLVMDLGSIGKIGAAPTKFRGMQVTKMNNSFIVAGEFQDSKSKVTIQFRDLMALKESVIKTQGNTAVILTLKKAK